MRFESLPRDWAQRPVTDPDVFEGVIDLVASEQSRAEGAIHVLLCHPTGRLFHPMSIGEHPSDPAEVMRGLTALLRQVVRLDVRHVVIAVARPGDPEPNEHDHALRAAFAGACRLAGVELIGAAVAGTGDVRSLPEARDEGHPAEGAAGESDAA